MTEESLKILGLKVPAHIGITEEERSRAQNVIVSVEVFADLTAAVASDEFADTIDYDRLTTDVAQLVRSSRSNLLEHLAGSIADHIGSLSGVERVTVEVSKESPPVREHVEEIAVRITRP
jgi:7,8-dihydroneopterin aldolase/epimerase/oxygenase